MSPDDREAVKQAAATLPVWWDRMAQEVRNNIAFKMDRYREEHRHASDEFIAARKVALFLAQVRAERRGPRQPFAAARGMK